MKYFSAKQIYSERKNLKGTIYRANREKWMRLNDFKGTIIELVTQKKNTKTNQIFKMSRFRCVSEMNKKQLLSLCRSVKKCTIIVNKLILVRFKKKTNYKWAETRRCLFNSIETN